MKKTGDFNGKLAVKIHERTVDITAEYSCWAGLGLAPCDLEMLIKVY